MSNGYGIDSINALGSDPMFWAALQAYNPNFRGTQQVAATDATYVQKPQVVQSQPAQALPKADYSEEGGLSAIEIAAGLGIAAVGAAAMIKGGGNPIKGGKALWDSFTGKVGKATEKAADALKANRAMKEFRFKAKDGSQIFVKDGKVVNIIEKGANQEIKGAKEINKFLSDKGINQADLLLSDITNINTEKLKAAGIELKFKEYSFKTRYNGKTILVENGKIAKIEGVEPKDVVTELGGQDKYDNFMKNIVEIVEKGGTPKRHAPTTIDVKSYEWSQNGITGTAIRNKKGGYRLGDTITASGTPKELTEAERDAYLENHKELNTTVQNLIEKGHAEGVNIERNFFYDTKGNQLFINQNGEIIGVKLKEAMKDSAGNIIKDSKGNEITLLKVRGNKTLLDSWLYNNPEAKEFAKKEFDSGLARDGSRFIAA